jgi:tRNA(Ile)-lysidine synthase
VPTRRAIEAELRAAVARVPPGRWLLAVSGGRDSIVLLDAFARWRDDVAGVATFDHGTGEAATRAATHVAREAMTRGLPVVSGAAASTVTAASARGTAAGAARAVRSEASLRAARWEFLNAWAFELNARVVTAHTREDQAETVFMRILRDAGARGLAGMRAASPVLRPLLGIARATVASYAAGRQLAWVEDPSNASLAYFRNRVRHELLPAFERAHRGHTNWLLDLSNRAGTLREQVAGLVDELLVDAGPDNPSGRGAGEPVIIPAATLLAFDSVGLEVLWPEITSRAGVTLDWRGLERLVRETPKLKAGSEVPLSGGASVVRTVTTFVVRNPATAPPLY